MRISILTSCDPVLVVVGGGGEAAVTLALAYDGEN